MKMIFCKICKTCKYYNKWNGYCSELGEYHNNEYKCKEYQIDQEILRKHIRIWGVIVLAVWVVGCAIYLFL